MKTYVSVRNLFQLDLPDEWQADLEDNLYTFYEGEHGDGDSGLQLSVVYYPSGEQFVPNHELENERKKYPTADIVALSRYEAVHYGLGVAEGMLQYRWITGLKHVKMFCTLTFKTELGEQQLDEIYEMVVGILDTLVIFPPEISDEDRIKENIIDQAKYFLLDAGEFFPFGAYINRDDEIVPVSVYLEDDHPESSEVLRLLERAIDLKLVTGDAKIAGIGTDVFYRAANQPDKKSAIHVQIRHTSTEQVGYYVLYENQNGSFVYGKPFKE